MTETQGEPIKVLVVDDQELFRRGITMLLSAEPGIEVVGEAGDGIEGTLLAEKTVPDVVLLDVRMPKRTGIEACLAIKESVPSAKIVMLTVSDEEADLYEAVKSGASGYLLKDSSIEEVAQAVKVVADGQSLISPSMAVKLIDEFKQMSKPERSHVPGSAADRARAGGAPPGGARDEQPGDLQAAVHQREHRQEPRPQHPGEAAAALPHGGRDVRRQGKAPRPAVTARLSAAQARRVALAAQGFTDRAHAVPTMRTLQRTLERTGVLQVDSVNVLQRAHYMPLYSRMGPYDIGLLHRAAERRPRRMVEYWAHVQAFMPVELWPVMRHRMDAVPRRARQVGDPRRRA